MSFWMVAAGVSALAPVTRTSQVARMKPRLPNIQLLLLQKVTFFAGLASQYSTELPNSIRAGEQSAPLTFSSAPRKMTRGGRITFNISRRGACPHATLTLHREGGRQQRPQSAGKRRSPRRRPV